MSTRTRDCEYCGEQFTTIFRRTRMTRFCSRSCAAKGRQTGYIKAVPTYEGCHIRVYQSRGKASDHTCQSCQSRPAQQWSFNLSHDAYRDNKGRPYSNDPFDYDPLCIRCHRERDITKCIRGHELSGDNLYRRPGTGYRACRECRRQARHRAAVSA